MLNVEKIEAGYGSRRVLRGVSAEVSSGEIVALVGPNGSGKSTLLNAIYGVVPLWRGAVRFAGRDLSAVPSERRASQGIAYVPQGPRIFSELSVEENLEVAGSVVGGRGERASRKDEVLRLFPHLAGRRRQPGSTLSGGERQMLALAMGIMPSPRLLLLDEPSAGLSDSLMNAVLDKLLELNASLRTALLIVEQRVRDVLRVAERAYVLRRGSVVAAGRSDELAEGSTLKDLFLG